MKNTERRPRCATGAWHVFRGVTFGAHGFGHLFFGLFGGEWLTIAGGSLMQLVVPLGAAVVTILASLALFRRMGRSATSATA